MRIRSLVSSMLAAAFVLGPAQGPAAAMSQDLAPPAPPAPLCRRAPALPPPPPEAAPQRAFEQRVPPPHLSAPPSPPPPGGGDDDSIVVTGVRSSLSRSVDSRRELPAGVSAEDIGAMPDRSVSEALARVPGVSAERFAGESEPEPDAPSGPSAFQSRNQPAPAPNLLTAGDYDDLLNPHLYARYVEGFLANETLAGVPRVDTARVLAITVLDRARRPAPFATVTITCADGNQLTLDTTADGAAIFFPELDRLGARVSVTVTHAGRTTPVRQIALPANNRAQRRTITIDSAAAPVRRLDLALVVDTTGSMADELEYLKSDLGAILADLGQDHRGLDIRLALIAYRDLGDQYVTRTFPLTNDAAALRGHLAQQSANGGGDYPEAMQDALARAVALDWRDDAVRSVLLVADAPPHAEDVAATWRAAEAARAARIQIVPVGASGVGPGAEYIMRAMAVVTQSRYIFLTDDSGIGNPHAPPSIDCYLVTSLSASIRRALDSQISGRRIEPREQEIIRGVGRYDEGRCLAPD